MPKQTRQHISNAQKAALRARHHKKPHLTLLDLKVWFEKTYSQTINQSSVSRILSAEFASLDDFDSVNHFPESRRRTEKWPELTKALLDWKWHAESMGAHVSQDTIREKGRQYWSTLYPDQEMPSFSNGWLRGFQTREQKNKQHGKFGDGFGTINAHQVIGLYKPQDIYSCDETSLYWKLVPGKNLSTQQMQNKSKARISILFCCNSDASDRVPLWFIGSSKRPKSFSCSGINIENLGCIWRSNQRAWMTGEIFKELLLWFENRMTGRKVVLLVDNFLAHENALSEIGPRLQNTLVILRPQYQLLNQGIIQAWKTYWRRQWIRFVTAEYDKGYNPVSTMTLLLAVRWAITAWSLDIKEHTIQSCFQGFLTSNSRGAAWEMDLDGIISEISHEIQQLQLANHIQETIDIDQFLDPEDESVDNTLMDIDEIILSRYAPTLISIEAGTEEEEEEIVNPLPRVTVQEALEALYKLRLYEEQQKDGNKLLIKQLLHYERVLLKRRSMVDNENPSLF